MAVSDILIRGAREHNLREVDLVLPRHQLICLTGVSGSGKSSLAFDTLYAEGQRRYVESLSSFARQFLGQMPKPDVDLIAGLSPSISISQKTTSQSPRSTVGTITEIHDYLRVLYARVGTGHCPGCDRPITAQTREQIVQRVAALPEGGELLVLAPLVRGQKGEYRDLFDDLLKQGFVRARVDGTVVRLDDDLRLDRQMRHNIEVVVERFAADRVTRPRLAEAVDLALRVGEGSLIVSVEREGQSPEELLLSAHYACTHCQRSFEPPSPQLFSFNSPQGMCVECSGLGEIYSFDPERLIPDASKSFQQGAVELLGRWRDLGRWKRHIYRGVAEALEKKYELDEGAVLELAWEEVDPRARHDLLWGTGEEHITYTWRAGASGSKWGGTWDGIIPQLLERYRDTKSRPHRRRLEKYMRVLPCGVCRGQRLNPQARAVKLRSDAPRFAERPMRSLPEVSHLPISEAQEFFASVELDPTGRKIAEEALKEIRGRLGFLRDVGLDYLTLDRTAPTLAGGEMQRIRLAGQIGCGLVGVLYILDEPSIGLHPRDNDRLLGTLAHLRDLGNTVLVVEHDEDTMRAADRIIDFGPGPGVRGGEIVADGSIDEVAAEPNSLTGQYLSGRRAIPVPQQRRILGATGDAPVSDVPTDPSRRLTAAGPGAVSSRLLARHSGHPSQSPSPESPVPTPTLTILNARHNNLQGVDVQFPLGTFICVTGVSGSGKSSLVGDILVEALRRDLNGGLGTPGDHDGIDGLEHLDKMIAIDQSPIGRTPRSNPATYIKVFDEIRRLYTQLPDSKQRGYQPGRFSFNKPGGRCEACEGNGSTRLEMDFLADIWVTCPVCNGHRFNRETLQVRFKGKSIADVLEMDIQQALDHFENVPKIADKLSTLHAVGLDYMKLGQPSPTLSGGEAQRVKLARELVKKSTGRTLYLLDEPTTGLHFADIELLLKVLHDFVDAGNTVVVVEHNLEVIKTADWLIDLGPEGGAEGGRIVTAGTPEQVAACEHSHTGRALRPLLAQAPGHRPVGAGEGEASAQPAVASKQPRRKKKSAAKLAKSIHVRGARQHNLKDVTLDVPREKFSVCCGPSGSGKTSLAMDTIYAEGQRRYVESLSSYARQFVGQMEKPRVEHIEGLSPAIAIEQKNVGHSPRSTVGTVTEIYDYLRILTARLGTPYCPDCDVPVGTQTAQQITDKVLDRPQGTRLYLLAPVDVQVGEKYEVLWEDLRRAGYVRVRIDSETHTLDDPPKIDRRRRHDVEVIVDRVTVRANQRNRVAESVENALSLGKGVLRVTEPLKNVPEADWPVESHSQHFACEECGRSFEPLSPHHFSFNSSLGWCPECEGLGVQTGTNPAALMRDPELSLAEGAIQLWPEPGAPMFQAMLRAFSQATGIPADVPVSRMGARHRRLLFHGTGERWFTAEEPAPDGRSFSLRFQYKGLWPALDEASRLSPALRSRLDTLIDEVECSACGGSRLRDDAAAVRVRGRTIDEFTRLPLGRLLDELRGWDLSERDQRIAGELVREVIDRTQFLVDIGLEYLTLGRTAPTLSGGEMQRIRLAAQVGSGLCGVLYVLDEPTIGLHPRDNRRLLNALKRLRDLGNTLLVVEHDREVIAEADRLIDFGPRAGKEGGEVVAEGTPKSVSRRRTSVTGPYISGKKAIAVPTNRRISGSKAGKAPVAYAKSPNLQSLIPTSFLTIRGARHHNLKGIDVPIPLGTLTVVTGVSGSGKSSLVEGVLYNALARQLHRAGTLPGAHDGIEGVEHVNKVIRVDQQPLGQTPTSNPATFTGVFELIRQLFAQLPDSKMHGFTARRFSFNVPGGRCEACEGNGQRKIEMHFLPDVWVECDECHGRRYNEETLSAQYRGRSIADVLDMSCAEALLLFQNIPKIRRILQTLCDVGLDYVTLGQPAPTLSGGEAQRVKLAAELSRPDTGRTLYLLDEPTTGLHFEDLHKLLEVLNRLVDLGNTVVVIEHNLDVIKTADWVIDLGPEAGDEGGYLVAAGTPEGIVESAKGVPGELEGAVGGTPEPSGKRKGTGKMPVAPKSGTGKTPVPPGPSTINHSRLHSYTAELLAPVLEAGPHRKRPLHDFEAEARRREGDLDITEVGRDTKMPWQRDGRRWHTRDRTARDGSPCRWEGRILAEVVDRIQQRPELFSETQWNDRAVVEIRAAKKSDGWFFHAITGEPWLLKMKFRTRRGTFQRDELVERLALKPLNDMPELPLYGRQPRTKVDNVHGPWQEIELRVHRFEEIDRPEFWRFVDEAVDGFAQFRERVEQKSDILQPWKQLGSKWHFARRGFPTGQTPEWDTKLLEEVMALLTETAPEGEVRWKNKQMVPIYIPARETVWAVVQTKKVDAVHLRLHGPKDRFTQGQIRKLGYRPKLDATPEDHDVIHFRFRTSDDVDRAALEAFLREHFDAIKA